MAARAITMVVMLLTAIPAIGDTLWTGVSDLVITNVANWDNGLPSLANPGTITNNETVTLGTITDWDLTLTNSAKVGNGGATMSFLGGVLTMRGSSGIAGRTDRNMEFHDACTLNIYDNAGIIPQKRDVVIDNASVVNHYSGEVHVRKLYLRTGSTYNFTSGLISVNERDAPTDNSEFYIEDGTYLNFAAPAKEAIVVWDEIVNTYDLTSVITSLITDGKIRLDGEIVTPNRFIITTVPREGDALNSNIELRFAPPAGTVVMMK